MSCDIYSINSTTYQFCHGESSRPWYVYALEAPNGHKAEAAIFLASACMFVLSCLLFSLSLFGRLSGRAALNPTVRVFLYASFSLFLPLMSYMFSQARDEAKLQQQQYRNGGGGDQQLPFRAQVILIWMLLVELLRKKVDAILAAMSSSPLRAVHHQTLWEAIDQIVRIAWIGYLIYSYTHGFRRPGFIILWLLTLVKAAQRIAAVELAKRSYAVGKNAYLIVGYTTQMIEEEERDDDQQASGPALLRKCWYAVMGEDRLKREAGPDGYRVELPDSDEMDLVTVGDIWELAEGGEGKPADRLLSDHPKLPDLCLSFALYKLLRARFENRQVDNDVTRKNRDLIFRGLGSGGDGDGDDDTAERVFHVIELELNFVSDYYHSVVPLVLSNPWCSSSPATVACCPSSAAWPTTWSRRPTRRSTSSSASATSL